MSAFRSSSSGFDGAIMHAEFMAFTGDESSFGTLRSFADRQGFPAAAVQMGGPEMFLQMLEQSPAPKLVIVDIDGQDDPAAVAGRLAGKCGAGCRLIAIGTANDVSLYRRMLASGLADYLVKPLSAEMLAQAYASALRGGTTGKGDAREAKIIIVIGSRGGVGATTIAVNSSWLLAHKFKFQCALLDLDLQFGTTSLALDLEPGRGLRDVVASPQRVDSLMVASSMVAASEHFSVLGAEESVEDHIAVDSSAITALLKEMRGNFDFIVVDLPRHMLATHKRLLAMAHDIVLVSELSLAGIRDTLRIKNALASVGSSSVTVVTSRVSSTSPAQVDTAAFEKGAQIKIDFVVPEDSKSVALAANTGKALGAVAADTPVTRALSALAAKLSGKPAAETPAKGSLLDWLWPSPKVKTKEEPRKTGSRAARDKP
ncbi:MAG: CpaE family protein [Bdellovibrionales bacterium]